MDRPAVHLCIGIIMVVGAALEYDLDGPWSRGSWGVMRRRPEQAYCHACTDRAEDRELFQHLPKLFRKMVSDMLPSGGLPPSSDVPKSAATMKSTGFRCRYQPLHDCCSG